MMTRGSLSSLVSIELPTVALFVYSGQKNAFFVAWMCVFLISVSNFCDISAFFDWMIVPLPFDQTIVKSIKSGVLCSK